jgi:adenylate cyclase
VRPRPQKLPAAEIARVFDTRNVRLALGHAMTTQATDPVFERALAAEIMVSERMRIRVLATILAILLLLDQMIFLFMRESLQNFTHQPLPTWLPTLIIGPFLTYETVALLALRYRAARGKDMPTFARFFNALIETSLPTVILWHVAELTGAASAFGTWPSALYFLYIAASTLRLDFALPAFTGAVAAIGYLGLVYVILPLDSAATDPALSPISHVAKAAVMLVTGIVAGLVAVRLRQKFRTAVQASASRERVINLFGQHLSPAVVDRLLERPAELTGETREICVMFLDIRDFTAHARGRRPELVVNFLNEAFAFMIEAVDRQGGFINKFLGDGFLAMFGAPLNDPAAARHAVAAAREILAEIDRRGGLAAGAWPLKVGIGLHLGPAVTGTIGSPRRKEFTAIGDTVNLASRLERLTKKYDARLIVSDAVVAALGEEASSATSLGAVAVRGYAEPLRVWRLDRGANAGDYAKVTA